MYNLPSLKISSFPNQEAISNWHLLVKGKFISPIESQYTGILITLKGKGILSSRWTIKNWIQWHFCIYFVSNCFVWAYYLLVCLFLSYWSFACILCFLFLCFYGFCLYCCICVFFVLSPCFIFQKSDSFNFNLFICLLKRKKEGGEKRDGWVRMWGESTSSQSEYIVWKESFLFN